MMTDRQKLIAILRDYQRWMKDGTSIGIEDIDGDETFGNAADMLEADGKKIEWLELQLSTLNKTHDAEKKDD